MDTAAESQVFEKLYYSGITPEDHHSQRNQKSFNKIQRPNKAQCYWIILH